VPLPVRRDPPFRFITATDGGAGFDDLSPSYLIDIPSQGSLDWLSPEFSWSSLVVSEDWPRFRQTVRECLQGGGKFEVACRLFHDGASPVLATVSGTVVNGPDGKPHFIEGVISPRRGAALCTGCREAIIQGEKKAKEFSKNILAVLSHDIRSPLIGVIGMLQLLRKSDLGEKQQECVTAASESCERILELAKNLLDFARIDSGQDSLNLQEVNLAGVVDSVAGMILDQAQRRGIFLDLEKDPDFPEALLCDEVKVRQILGNLLSNAIKFTPDGSVGVTLSHAPRPDGKATVILEVTDTGIGFDPDKTRFMFDQFAQLCHDRNLRHMGAGLGLNIVQGLVRLFGGDICAEARPGRGSSFRVSFPAERCRCATPDAAS